MWTRRFGFHCRDLASTTQWYFSTLCTVVIIIILPCSLCAMMWIPAIRNRKWHYNKGKMMYRLFIHQQTWAGEAETLWNKSSVGGVNAALCPFSFSIVIFPSSSSFSSFFLPLRHITHIVNTETKDGVILWEDVPCFYSSAYSF